MSLVLKYQVIEKKLIILFVTMSIIGAYFYLGSPSFSFGFIMVPIAIWYIIKKINTIKFTTNNLFFLAFYFLSFTCSILAVFINTTDDNLRVVKFLLLLGVNFLLFKVIAKNELQKVLDKVVILSTLIIFTILILQFSYLLTGVGIDPFKDDTVIIHLVPTSVYVNPNDLSVVSLVLLIYVLYMYKSVLKNGLVLVLVLLIFISASRLCIVFSLVFLVLNFRGFLKFKYLAGIFVVLGIMLSLDIGFTMEDIAYTVNRVSSIPEHFGSNISNLKLESSMGQRVKSLTHFISNIFEIGFGNYNFKDYNNFFKGTDFYGGLMAKNPHNFFVELSLLYGVFGVTAALCLILYIVNSLINLKHSLLLILTLLLILCVPSSVINFLPIWVVILIVLKEK